MKKLLLLLLLSSCSYDPNDRFVDKRVESQYIMDVGSFQMAYSGFLGGYMIHWASVTNEIDSTNQSLKDLYDVALPALLVRLECPTLHPVDYQSFGDIYEAQCLSGRFIKIRGPISKPGIMIPPKKPTPPKQKTLDAVT